MKRSVFPRRSSLQGYLKERFSLIPVSGLLFFNSVALSPASAKSIVNIQGINEISGSEIALQLIITGFLTVIILVITYYSSRIRKLRAELMDKEQIISDSDNAMRAKASPSFLNEDDNKEDTVSTDFLSNLIQELEIGIGCFDRDYRLVYGNDSFFSLTDIKGEEFTFNEFLEGLHPEHNDFRIKLEEGLLRDGFYNSEISIRHRDGNYVILSTHSTRLKNQEGKAYGLTIVIQDITSLKKDMEEMLRANIESEAGNKMKAGFLANISHEIRTPLNSVVGFSNLLLEDNLPRETKEEYLEHINYNSEKLLQIIGDIIDLSRLSSSQIEITYEEASLSSLVKEVIDEGRIIIKRTDKPIALNLKNKAVASNDLIFTDRVWLKRVLNHLLDNAIKFTLDGSIELTYSVENNDVIFSVKDTGIGINKENLGRIFEEFSQEVGGHHRPFEGLGVGLTLAKEVVERMGGKITVRSEKGMGSEFSFNIPYRPAGTKTRHTTLIDDNPLRSIDWRNRKCLLVDDNKDVLIYLNRILVDTGIAILTARSGNEAIEIIKSDRTIDVIILDMQMPEMNGIEATKEIKKIRGNLPIIAQTAFVFENDTDIILEAGCDACLIKPIRREHLITVMSSFIRSGQ